MNFHLPFFNIFVYRLLKAVYGIHPNGRTIVSLPKISDISLSVVFSLPPKKSVVSQLPTMVSAFRHSEFDLYRPFPSVHCLAPFLSIPRVWDTSQQAIFNRRAAAREGENTEVGTRFLCLLRMFLSLMPLPLTTELCPVLPNFRKRKTLQSSKKDYNAL